ncbi:hypothetical protein P280DRAFT_531189 [Massarina eburnea CBS 473.64]|uniref:Uncharacterized protein n=1 Tax=Massarina eburnea CBS 473.64 TaxID=1395130 RepID=A0A6A6SDH7_9PLEO|nr:hypothetical protein P280DRAFT_531189 [Massarina eburnea CBS 473.64]
MSGNINTGKRAPKKRHIELGIKLQMNTLLNEKGKASMEAFLLAHGVNPAQFNLPGMSPTRTMAARIMAMQDEHIAVHGPSGRSHVANRSRRTRGSNAGTPDNRSMYGAQSFQHPPNGFNPFTGPVYPPLSNAGHMPPSYPPPEYFNPFPSPGYPQSSNVEQVAGGNKEAPSYPPCQDTSPFLGRESPRPVNMGQVSDSGEEETTQDTDEASSGRSNIGRNMEGKTVDNRDPRTLPSGTNVVPDSLIDPFLLDPESAQKLLEGFL